MTVCLVKPYREAWFQHLLRLQFRTAFCALFGIVRWKIPARRCRLLDNFGFTIPEEVT